MRTQMKEIADEIKSKDEKYRELLQEYSKMQKETGYSVCLFVISYKCKDEHTTQIGF